MYTSQPTQDRRYKINRFFDFFFFSMCEDGTRPKLLRATTSHTLIIAYAFRSSRTYIISRFFVRPRALNDC